MAPEVSFFLSAEFVTTFAATCRKVLHPSGLGQVDQRTDLASGVLPASDFARQVPTPHRAVGLAALASHGLALPRC